MLFSIERSTKVKVLAAIIKYRLLFSGQLLTEQGVDVIILIN